MMQNKDLLKVLIFVENPTSFQHLLRSRILDEVAEKNIARPILILQNQLVPGDIDQQKLDRFEHCYLDFSGIRPHDLFGRLVHKLSHSLLRDLFVLYAPDDTQAQDRKFKLRHSKSGWKVRMAYAYFLKMLGVHWKHISRIGLSWGHYPQIANLLDKHEPDLVIYFNFLLGRSDYLKEAKRRSIPLLLDIPNWDQASSKGPMTVIPDHIFVWSPSIKDQLVRIHEIPEDCVHYHGAVCFDYYFQNNNIMDRNTFCHKYGIDPSHHIILYAYGQPSGIRACEPIAEELLKMIDDIYPDIKCHLLFRASPRVSFPKELVQRSRLSMQYPCGTRLEGVDWMPSPDEDYMRMSTIAHSSVVVNMFSTMMLDSICMDKPVINLGYACEEQGPNPQKMERFFTYTHIASVISNPGTEIPRSREELKESILKSIKHPTATRQYRQKLGMLIIGKMDGKCYQRWIQSVSKILQSSYLTMSPKHNQ
ncbi:MAG: hypothetical protein AAF135_23675 [Bacteroidota bacterium]